MVPHGPGRSVGAADCWRRHVARRLQAAASPLRRCVEPTLNGFRRPATPNPRRGGVEDCAVRGPPHLPQCLGRSDALPPNGECRADDE